MNKSFPMNRLIIISLLFIMWTIFAVETFPYSRVQIIPFLLCFTATILLIFRKRWTDFISFIIFTVNIIGLFTSAFAYCDEQKLNAINLCGRSVFHILLNLSYSENLFNMISAIAAVYLATILLKSLFKNELQLK